MMMSLSQLYQEEDEGTSVSGCMSLRYNHLYIPLIYMATSGIPILHLHARLNTQCESHITEAVLMCNTPP